MKHWQAVSLAELDVARAAHLLRAAQRRLNREVALPAYAESIAAIALQAEDVALRMRGLVEVEIALDAPVRPRVERPVTRREAHAADGYSPVDRAIAGSRYVPVPQGAAPRGRGVAETERALCLEPGAAEAAA